MPKQVAWFKDGEPVVRSRKTMMQYIDGASILVIYDTDLADAGLYECYAENEHGNDKCTIPVKIKRVRNRFSLFFLARINEPLIPLQNSRFRLTLIVLFRLTMIPLNVQYAWIGHHQMFCRVVMPSAWSVLV